MQTLLWILLFVYAAFSLVWAVRYAVTQLGYPQLDAVCRRSHWSYRLGFYLFGRERLPLRFVYLDSLRIGALFMWLLAVAVLFMVSPILHPRQIYNHFIAEPRKKREMAKEREKQVAEAKARNERIEAYKKENPAVIYYNTINGVTAVMAKVSYDHAVREYERAVRDGRLPKTKVMPPNSSTYLYCHASAKNVPETHKTGWLSDFDDLKELAKVECRKDIFVPFVSEDIVSFEEQLKAIPPGVYYREPLERRTEQTKRNLTQVSVPQEVMYPKQ